MVRIIVIKVQKTMYVFPMGLIYIRVLILGDCGCGKRTMLKVMRMFSESVMQKSDIELYIDGNHIALQFSILSGNI